MKPIHFQGLNCYHDCITSIANYFGINYPAIFSTLWSETDFRYDPYRETYLTKRILTNLEVLGVKIEDADCFSQEDVDRNLSLVNEGQFMIVGIDAFYISWNPFYQTFHGPHYFIVQNAKTETLLCIDPTYNKENEQISRQEFIEHTFDICRINEVKKKTLQIDTIHEAQEIVRTHPNTRSLLLSHIYDCVNGKQEQADIVLLAKYIDAMICNRYLYRFFLKNYFSHNENHLLLNDDFFLEWKAVKNGLYKASVSRNNESIINDICNHFSHLIDEEISIVEKIICSG